MALQRIFGKLGKRKLPRLGTSLDATLALTDRTSPCHVENLSRKGCRIRLEVPPRLGITVLMRIDRIEAIGTVVWVRGNRCGVVFSSPVAVELIERVRWIVEHEQAHAKSKITTAGAVWR